MHLHLLKGESLLMCIGCEVPLTVQHILINCVNFALCRSKYFSAATLLEIFENVNTHDLIDFIEGIGLCHKL